MELEQVLNQQKIGKFINDEEENEGFPFQGRTLSKIKSKTIEETFIDWNNEGELGLTPVSQKKLKIL